MVEAALRSGAASRRCVFEVFARRLPDGRRYGVVAGTGRLLEALGRFTFEDDELVALEEAGVVDAETLRWLSGYRFTGDVWGYGEGECFVPGSPMLVVEGTFAEAVVLETLVLSILNHDSAIAAAASRMTTAAHGRPCLEMGSRRTHEEAAVAAARAAYVAGFVGTSNLEAGRRYGIPTIGTAAHAFTLAPRRRAERLRRPGRRASAPGRRCSSTPTTSRRASRTAVEVAGTRARRRPARLRRPARAGLRGAGPARRAPGARRPGSSSPATSTSTPSPRWPRPPSTPTGSGTSLVTGSGAPTAGLVYKLVAREDASGGRSSASPRQSRDKTSIGGRKWALRRRGSRRGRRRPRSSASGTSPVDDGDDRPLLRPARRARRDRRRRAAVRRPRPARRLARRAARDGPAALPRRAGDPDRCIPTQQN